VGSIIADQDLVVGRGTYSVGEFKVAGARELSKLISMPVEDDNSHDLALHHDNSALVVDAHTSWVLEDIGSEFADELT